MHADWLALRWESPELPCYFVDVNMHGVVQKIVKIPSICQNKVVFGIPSYSMCVVYKKNKIIHLSDSEGGGYLPCKSSAPQVSTIIHLHFGELCNSTEAPIERSTNTVYLVILVVLTVPVS